MTKTDEINQFYCEFSKKIDQYILAQDHHKLQEMDILCDQYIQEFPEIAFALWYCKSNIAAILTKKNDDLTISEDVLHSSNLKEKSPIIKIDTTWKPLMYLRRAVWDQSFDSAPINFKVMILTNIGNASSNVNRFIEAIEFYNYAIANIPNFSVALYNRGNLLYKFANWLSANPEIETDLTPVYFLYNEALKSFELAFQKDAVWATSDDNIKIMHKEYDEVIFPNIQSMKIQEVIKNYKFHSDDFFKGSTEEIAYQKWSLKEHLYLDPINLITTDNIAGYDYLSLPPYLCRQEEQTPEFFHWFLLLKQEYIASRYLLFQSIELQGKEHFWNENSDLFTPNEFVLTSYDGSEKDHQSQFVSGLESALMKASFSKAYGIFDKIAEFIFAFWQLDTKDKKRNKHISINNVWYNNLEFKNGINTVLINDTNWFLKGLYHLSYDIVGKEISQEDLLPEFKRLQEIRNKLEHTEVIITKDTETESLNQLMSISEKDFVKCNLFLLRLIRNALFYLSLAASLNQSQLKII
ncbi:unnamed protein product [Commensalibacter communis]|uniref:LA2681 family HEPN domain-containing protein n=1 Tax=Commensalibacter communis TaxID=2972786 RepID=UPI0022FF8D88|nr:LA2681 family HEPN domain-containing protein [Commensalibacter communis]CAI3941175.1 unnamed protein product [Commensalibacter communis]